MHIYLKKDPVKETDQTKEQLLTELEILRSQVAILRQEVKDCKGEQVFPVQENNAIAIKEDLATLAKEMMWHKRLLQKGVEVLRETESLYRTLTRNFPNGAVFLFDTDLRYLIADGAGLATVGLSKERLEGKTIWEALPEQTCQVLEPIYREVLAGDTLVTEKHWGDRIYSVYALPVRNETGEIFAGMVMTQDITERKHAEEYIKFQANILSQVSDAVIAIDVAHHVTYWNKGAERLYELQAENVLGQNLKTIDNYFWFKAEDKQLAYQSLATIGFWQGENIHINAKKKEKIYVESSISVLKDQNNNLIGMLAVSRDITARKELEKTLRQQAKILEEANRLKNQFLAVVSHELRNPLNAILGWSQFLRIRKCNQETNVRALETIERNAKSQLKMIEDVLDASRIIQGNLVLNLRPLDPTMPVYGAIDLIRPLADAKKIQLDFVISCSVHQILADQDRLQQVIWNLLSNAIKFTPEGGRIEVQLDKKSDEITKELAGTVNTRNYGSSVEQSPVHPSSCTLLPSQTATEYAQIQISDTGEGISPEFLPHIFQKFSQADSSNTRRQGGIGLGLAIARHLVELHGGGIQAQSLGTGQGATFTVKLPVIKER